MRVYVAGKWEEKRRVSEVMRLLESEGHVITYDWTKHPDTTNDDELAEQAWEDYTGVRQAEAFVGVFEKPRPQPDTGGTYVELGIALDRGIPVYILGHEADHCIFTRLPQVQRGIDRLLRLGPEKGWEGV
jgi:nucleoside 2-deoxyribosyltransferase